MESRPSESLEAEVEQKNQLPKEVVTEFDQDQMEEEENLNSFISKELAQERVEKQILVAPILDQSKKTIDPNPQTSADLEEDDPEEVIEDLEDAIADQEEELDEAIEGEEDDEEDAIEDQEPEEVMEVDDSEGEEEDSDPEEVIEEEDPDEEIKN